MKTIIMMLFVGIMLVGCIPQPATPEHQPQWKYQKYTKPLALFPKKAFGYWEYEQNKNVFQTNIEDYISEFKRRDLPLSGLVIEPCWQREYNELSWNDNYPEPARMISKVNDMGVSIGLWENGWLDPNCANWEEALEHGFLLPFTRPNWVGTLRKQSRQLDSKNPEAVRWWVKQHEPLLDINVELFKLDAGYAEGASSLILSGPFAKQTEEYSGKRILALKCWGGWARDDEEVSTGLWQGDPWPRWLECRDGVLISIINGLNGSWFFGPEIGALDGRGNNKVRINCSPELYQRWCAWGMCAPHPSAMGGKTGREPWKLGADCERTFRKFAKWRMRLTPFVYSYNWNAYRTKEPLMRALAIDFPNDPKCDFDYYTADPMALYGRDREVLKNLAESDDPNFVTSDSITFSEQENYEFMFGKELLVAPVVWKGWTARDIYLPEGTEWIDYTDGKTIYEGGQTLKSYPAALDEMPMFVKAGSIIPMGPDMHFIDEKPLDELTLDIYPSKSNTASFLLYEDDGISLDYRKGAHSITRINCGKLNDRRLVVEVSAGEGVYDGKVKQRKYLFKIHRQKHNPNEVLINGEKVEGWNHRADEQLLLVSCSASTDKSVTLVVKR